MYVSLYGDATYQVTRTDGLAFDEEPKSITYEVDGGIAEGKTHEDIADQVAAVTASVPAVGEEAPAEDVAATGSGSGTTAAEESTSAEKPAAEATSGAASNAVAGTIVGIITSTLMI